jgi:hydrogenase 3 maturation protease
MNLRERLLNEMRGNIVVVGIGNPSRGDDAAGSCVAQRISAARGVQVIDAQDVPENHLCQIVDERPDTILLVDSVDLHGAPGSLALLDQDQTAAYWPSTHRVPIALLVDYLEKTTRAQILLIAIQPGQTDFLRAMSDEVVSSVEALADILNEVFATRQMPANPECAEPLKQEARA